MAERIAALNHEAVDDPVKHDAVIKRLRVFLAGLGVLPLLRAVGKTGEVGDGLGRLFVEEFCGEGSEGRVEMRVNRHALLYAHAQEHDQARGGRDTQKTPMPPSAGAAASPPAAGR